MDIEDMTPKIEKLWRELDNYLQNTAYEWQERKEYEDLFDVLEETAYLQFEARQKLKEALKILEKEYSKWEEDGWYSIGY